MTKVRSLVALVCALLAAPAGAMTLTVNPHRLVEIIDVIDGSALVAAQSLDSLSAKSKAPIYVLLNSPGGSTVSGYSVADAMVSARARGAKLICVSGVFAASMAFNLLAYCDQRYALAHTKLLFHEVRVSSERGLTADEMGVLTPQMRRLEQSNTETLIKMMGVSPAWFQLHYKAETLWDAEDLVSQTNPGWLQIVDDVVGAERLFVVEKPKALFDFFAPGPAGSRGRGRSVIHN